MDNTSTRLLDVGIQEKGSCVVDSVPNSLYFVIGPIKGIRIYKNEKKRIERDFVYKADFDKLTRQHYIRFKHGLLVDKSFHPDGSAWPVPRSYRNFPRNGQFPLKLNHYIFRYIISIGFAFFLIKLPIRINYDIKSPCLFSILVALS